MDIALERLVWQPESPMRICQLPQAFSPLPHAVDHIVARQHHGPTGRMTSPWPASSGSSRHGVSIVSRMLTLPVSGIPTFSAARRLLQLFPSTASMTQHPLTCGPSPRQ